MNNFNSLQITFDLNLMFHRKKYEGAYSKNDATST